MADLLCLTVELVHALMSRVAGARTNREGCRLLARLAEQTLDILKTLAKKKFDSSVSKALELVNEALKEARKVVDKCCNASRITAVLYYGSYASSLQQAAEKLEHALSQIPLAALGLAADIHSAVAALSFKIRSARFEEREATERQTKALKDAFERSFNQGGQGLEGVKNLIQELLQQQSSSKEELKKELVVLKEYACEAKKKKEKQFEFELEQIIEVLSESVSDVGIAPKLMRDLENCFRCPISKEIMRDPVVLKESGMTYERSSITEWLGQGHRHDPLTNVELVSGELVLNHTFKNACQILHGQFKSSSSIPNVAEEDSQKFQLMPGLYEGYGKLTLGLSIVHVLQLLIIEPNGKLLGYTLYKNEHIIIEENMLEIGGGEWNDITNELSFGDNQHSYNGVIAFGADYQRVELEWNGKVFKANAPNEEHSFTLAYSCPPIQRSLALHPTILQMEGVLEASGSKAKYKSQIVLSLEVDLTIGGWMWFEALEQDSKFVGHVIDGRWDYDGALSFPVYFLHNKTPLNSDITPTNHSTMFKVSGNVSQDESFLHSKFTAIATKTKHEDGRRINMSTNVPLDNIPIFEYTLIRESSTPWYHLHPNPLKPFNMSRTYESRNVDYSIKANFDLSYGSFSHFLRTWGRTPLHIASWNNSIGIVKELLANGADLNVKDNSGQSPLHLASFTNSIDVVKELIEAGANVDIQDMHGKTPLHIAFDRAHSSIIKELLDNGANTNIQDENGWTFSHHSADSSSEVDGEPSSNGASVERSTHVGYTSMHIACEENRVHIVKKLIAKGININSQDSIGRTPLYVASKNSHTRIVKELIVNEANVNLQQNDGASPLHIASQKNHVDIVKELIVSGASIDLPRKDGWTSLHIASRRNHINVVKELIANGAVLDLQQNDGACSLHIASLNNCFDVVKELIDSGASVDLSENNGWTPLHIATQKNHTRIVKELIVYGASIDFPKKDGCTSLHIATQKNHINIVKELIGNGANINLQQNDGASPLYIASQNNHIDIVKELIANGADANLQSKKGRTPLHVASYENHIDVVVELVANNAKVDVQDKNGQTPLHMAASNGRVSIVQILIAHGASKDIQTNAGKAPYDVVCASKNLKPYEDSTIKELKALLKP